MKKFSLESLREKYGLISKKGQIGYRVIDSKIHKNLIEDIEKASKHGTHNLSTVTQDFNDGYCICEFKNHDSKRKNHFTFIEERGIYYIEKHHLIERNLIRKHSDKISNIDAIINDKRNIFKLCPNCHREIHHGRKERKREKIKYLYENDKKKKEFFDKNLNELKNGKSTLEWLYEVYKCD